MDLGGVGRLQWIKNIKFFKELIIDIENKCVKNLSSWPIANQCQTSSMCKRIYKNFLLMAQLLISSKVLTGKNPQSCKECGTAFNSFSDFNKYLWIYYREKSCKHKEYGKVFQQSSNVSIRECIREKSHMNVKNMSKL